MADISKLKVEETVYNIKDLEARSSASNALKMMKFILLLNLDLESKM